MCCTHRFRTFTLEPVLSVSINPVRTPANIYTGVHNNSDGNSMVTDIRRYTFLLHAVVQKQCRLNATAVQSAYVQLVNWGTTFLNYNQTQWKSLTSYPRRAWAATGIVVCWSVCLSQVYLLTWVPQLCVYSMYSLHRTIS